jgi:hypothetical protein
MTGGSSPPDLSGANLRDFLHIFGARHLYVSASDRIFFTKPIGSPIRHFSTLTEEAMKRITEDQHKSAASKGRRVLMQADVNRQHPDEHAQAPYFPCPIALGHSTCMQHSLEGNGGSSLRKTDPIGTWPSWNQHS